MLHSLAHSSFECISRGYITPANMPDINMSPPPHSYFSPIRPQPENKLSFFLNLLMHCFIKLYFPKILGLPLDSGVANG